MPEVSPDLPTSKAADPGNAAAHQETDAGSFFDAIPPIRVLIVDDHDPVRRGIRLLLSTDASVSICGEAADGMEAVEKAAALRPDVILMDITMPRMDGFAATRAIKQALPTTRVILVSQNDPGIVEHQAAEVNADGFVVKSELSQHLIPKIWKAAAKPEHALDPRRAQALQSPEQRGLAGSPAESQAGLADKDLPPSQSLLPAATASAPKLLSFSPSSLATLRDHRERLELMARASGIGFWFCDLPFDKLVWDERVKEHFWYPPEARITIEMFYARLHPEDRERTRETIERSIANNKPYDLEYRTVADDGRLRWIRAIGWPFYDQAGRPIRFDGLTIDVTAKRREEEATGLLAAIVASSDDAIVSKNLNGIITSWNKSAERLFGYTAQEAIGQHITLIIPRNRLGEEDEILSRIRSGRRVDHFETVRVRKDGTTIELSLTISPVVDRDGRVIGASKVARDIGERKRAERALRASEERERKITADALAATAKFRAIFEQTTVFAGIMTRDGILMEANRTSLEGCGYQAGEVLGLPFWETVWWRNFPESQAKIRNAISPCARGIPYQDTLLYSWADGAERIMTFALHPIVDDRGEVLYLHPTGVDITDVKLMEEKYRKLSETLDGEVRARTRELEERNVDILRQSEQLRELSRRLLLAQDEERRHIARELHDSAGQTLTVLGMSVSHLAQQVGQYSDALQSEAAAVQDLVQQLHREIRTASYLLHPPLLDENGLASALNWYVQGVTERSGLEINLAIAKDLGRLPGDLELLVFRLVQECLTNVHRHSGSRTASIRIARDQDAVSVEVRDQGQGLSPDKLVEMQSSGSGVGIRGMRERLRHFQGKLNIESSSLGTVVLAAIPIPRQPVAGKAAAMEAEWQLH
jgi:PAS domain S-box-containing protein